MGRVPSVAMSAHDERRVKFRTSDDMALDGDLVVPSTCAAAAVVCHPHPQYGGDRFNPVVEAIYRALPEVGVAALRFDFRSPFDDGVGERLDALGALDLLRSAVPELPLLAAGYSFGALIALATTADDLAGRVLVAPPLGHAPAPPTTTVPTLVLTPAHDQFASPEAVRPIVESWTDTEFVVIDMADHFIAGQTRVVADRIAEWVSDRWPLRSQP